MARDDDDELEDDEYHPRKRGDERPRRTPVPVVIVLVVATAVVLGAVVLLVVRNRQAAEQARRALGENEAQLDRALADHEKLPVAVNKPRSNWEKVVGTWVREKGPPEAEKGGRPHRFEFRPDKTATTIRTNIDGNPQQHDGRIEILTNLGGRLMLRMEIPNGTISYTFHYQPNGTLVLDSSTGNLVFTRVK